MALARKNVAVFVSLLLLLLVLRCGAQEYDFGGIDSELGDFEELGLGDFEDGIGPGEDFGDYEDKYTSGGEDESPEDEDELPAALQEDNPASHMVGVLDLDHFTFDKMHDGSRKLLVEMYAPWDRACKEVVPLVRELGKKFASDQGILIAKADVDRFSKLASRFGITTYTKRRTYKYPHFMLFTPQNPEGQHYGGELTASALTEFALGLAKAGIVEQLIPLVHQFMMAQGNRDLREQIMSSLDEAVQDLAPDFQESSGYHKKVMASVLEKGDEYVSKELERISNIVKAGNLQLEKLLSFRTRMNILKLFVTASPHDEL